MAEKIWISGTFTGVYDNTYGAFMLTLSGEYIWTTQETYNAWQANTDPVTVIYDGEEFICEVQEISGLGKVIGNLSSFGGVGNNEPFALGVVADQGLYAWIILSTVDTQPTQHTVEVYQVEASAAFAVVLKDRSGADVTYEVPSEQIKLNTPNGTQIFTAGQAVENVPITLDLADGDQTVNAPEGVLVKSATIYKPETLVPENIKKNVNIAGITGALESNDPEATHEYVAIIQRELSGDIYNSYVTNIGSYAFTCCSALTGVDFPNATSIGSSAFSSCTSLQSVNIPNATSIGAAAFSGCTSLQSVNIPNATSIGNYAFTWCSALTAVDFPNATSIGSFAFNRCTSLQSVNIPNATSIGYSAFYSCWMLTSVKFLNATSIGSSAFAFCSALSAIYLSRVNNIASYAFQQCSKLASLYLLGSSIPTANGSFIFYSTTFTNSSFMGYYGSIFVRESLLASFKTKLYWSVASNRYVGLTDDQIAELGVT